MTPTIVLEDPPKDSSSARPALRLVLGSPGGGTIINTVLEVLLNALVYHLDIQQAVNLPRFHNQWMPDKVFLERDGFSTDTVEKLRAAGYKIQWIDSIGECEAIEIDSKTGWRFSAADARGDGKAVGY